VKKEHVQIVMEDASSYITDGRVITERLLDIIMFILSNNVIYYNVYVYFVVYFIEVL
jgi:hypothetical protein